MTPPTMRVAVEISYVHGCAECVAIIEATAGAAFRDPQVTKFVAIPANKHAHTEGTHDQRKAIAERVAERHEGELFAPISDTNGSDPEAVTRMLDREMGGGQ